MTIKTDKANMAGITNEDVAMLLQTGLSGVAPTYLREQDRLIPITFRLRSDERARIEEINDLDVGQQRDERRGCRSARSSSFR